MVPCRLLVVTHDRAHASTLTQAVPPAADVVWHPADDGGVFMSVLHDGLWDAIVFWGAPTAYAGGRGLDLVKATAPDLPLIIVAEDAAIDLAAEALHAGARALIPVADLPQLSQVVAEIQAGRRQGRETSDMTTVARQHSERYRGLLELSPEPLFVHRQGRIIYSNNAMARLLGLPGRKELEGRTMLDFLHPDDRAKAVQRVQHVWSVADLPPAEWRVYRLDGSLCHLETSAWPIIYEDEPANLLVCRDITERILSHEALQRLLVQEQEARVAADAARERLRFLADVGSVVNAQLDRQATLQNLANVMVPRMADWCVIDEVHPGAQPEVTTIIHTGPAADGMRAFRERIPVDLASDHLIARVFRRGRGELIPDLQAMDPDLEPDIARIREIRRLGIRSIVSAPLIARGRVLGVLSLGVEKDRRPYGPDDLALMEEVAHKAGLALDNARLYEALQESDHRKEEFLGLLGHELRNPLAAIRNAVTLVQRRAEQPDDVTRWTAVIDRQQRLLSRLVADLLDVSRINSGKIALDLQPVDLTAIVRDGVDNIRQAHGLTGEQIRLTLPVSPLLVNGDAVRLSQIVGNLLDNAWKHNVPGGHVDVMLAPDAKTAKLTIADTGVGIAPEALTTIFEPFVQVFGGDRAKAGLGLGLTLVKRLTDLHGGTISAASPGTGQGSEFQLQLPLLAAGTPAPPLRVGEGIGG
jgi:PAS domain S-box-containing protein